MLVQQDVVLIVFWSVYHPQMLLTLFLFCNVKTGNVFLKIYTCMKHAPIQGNRGGGTGGLDSHEKSQVAIGFLRTPWLQLHFDVLSFLSLAQSVGNGYQQRTLVGEEFTRKLPYLNFFMWASTRENLSSGVCEQHRRRPACAAAQSDQRLCYSFFAKYHI